MALSKSELVPTAFWVVFILIAAAAESGSPGKKPINKHTADMLVTDKAK